MGSWLVSAVEPKGKRKKPSQVPANKDVVADLAGAAAEEIGRRHSGYSSCAIVGLDGSPISELPAGGPVPRLESDASGRYGTDRALAFATTLANAFGPGYRAVVFLKMPAYAALSEAMLAAAHSAGGRCTDAMYVVTGPPEGGGVALQTVPKAQAGGQPLEDGRAWMHAAAVAGGLDSITVLLTVDHQDEKHCVQQDKANEFQIRPGMGRDLALELARAGLFNHDPSTGILRLNALLSDGQGGRNAALVDRFFTKEGAAAFHALGDTSRVLMQVYVERAAAAGLALSLHRDSQLMRERVRQIITLLVSLGDKSGAASVFAAAGAFLALPAEEQHDLRAHQGGFKGGGNIISTAHVDHEKPFEQQLLFGSAECPGIQYMVAAMPDRAARPAMYAALHLAATAGARAGTEDVNAEWAAKALRCAKETFLAATGGGRPDAVWARVEELAKDRTMQGEQRTPAELVAALVAAGEHTWAEAGALVHGQAAAAQVQAELVAGGYSWAEARALVLKLLRMPKKARVQAKARALGKKKSVERVARW